VALVGGLSTLDLTAPAGTLVIVSDVELTGELALLQLDALAGEVAVTTLVDLVGEVATLAIGAPAGTFAALAVGEPPPPERIYVVQGVRPHHRPFDPSSRTITIPRQQLGRSDSAHDSTVRQAYKDPDATLDYVWDWTAWLTDDETIATVEWIVPDGITQGDTSNTTTTATTWFSGGTVGDSYPITCRITTDQGRIDDRTKTLRIKDR
jgi:predicted Abi (CAAX) family protease